MASKLRPHQREGVQFLFECTMGLRGFDGQGCILADDMGLGKTLMSITILWTLMNQGFLMPPNAKPALAAAGVSAYADADEEAVNTAGDGAAAGALPVSRAPPTALQGAGQALHHAVRKVMVVCPTSLVGNWDNELRKWIGDHVPTFAVKGEPKKMIKSFLMHRGKGVLIVSYETQRLYSKLFENAMKNSIGRESSRAAADPAVAGEVAATAAAAPIAEEMDAHSLAQRFHSNNSVCDLLICDEAHKLKNADSNLAKSLEVVHRDSGIAVIDAYQSPF